MSTALQRTLEPEPGTVGCVIPFGVKMVNGAQFDFDKWYSNVLAPCIVQAGMKPVRLDEIYGPQGMEDLVWQMLQKAEMIVVDHTGQSANVNFELGICTVLNKRFISITQDPLDIPTDIRGRQRYLRYSPDVFDVDSLRVELVGQLQALREEPANEMDLVPMKPLPEQVTATVVTVERDCAVVRSGDRVAALRATDVEWSRTTTDMTKRFRVGETVRGAFVYDVPRGDFKFSLIAGQENPWLVVAAKRPVGAEFTGRVVRVDPSIGVFVRVHGPINGLVRRHSFGTGPLPLEGTELNVAVSNLDTGQRRIMLDVVGTVPAAVTVEAPDLPEVGARFMGTVMVAQGETPEHRGGYALLKLDGFEQLAMLHASKMQEDLRADLNEGTLEREAQIAVEVISVDATRNRIQLSDLGDIDLTPQLEATDAA